MRTTVAAVVCIFGLFMVCGTILVILERDEIAATLFTSGISFLMGCGITVITREGDRDNRKALPEHVEREDSKPVVRMF